MKQKIIFTLLVLLFTMKGIGQQVKPPVGIIEKLGTLCTAGCRTV